MANTAYKSGQWNFICDSCGQKLKSGVARLRWDGFRVCSSCWEYRHPQDFLRTKPDNQAVPWSRPRTTDSFVVLDFTSQPIDAIIIDESVVTTADYWRYIGRITFPNDADLVNGSAINLLTINSNSVDPAPPTNFEAISFTESVTSVRGQNITINDSIVFSESVSEEEGEFPSDTVGLLEAVTFINATNKLINAHLVNEVLLG
jgi:hypothetical protein